MLKALSVSAAATIMVLVGGCSDQEENYSDNDTVQPQSLADSRPTTRELNLAWGTKIFCSTVFVSGLPEADALEHSVYPAISIFPDALSEGEITHVHVDRDLGKVELGTEEYRRSATYHGDQGCVLTPRDGDGINFTPRPVVSTLPSGNEAPWPAGDTFDVAENTDLDSQKLKQVIDTVFHEGSYTAAFVAVHKGKVIAERYDNGADRDSLLVNWSMGKSLTATLLGVLFEQGEFDDIDMLAPIPEWKNEGDPRSEIRISDLLRMSSGLEFSHVENPREDWNLGHPDHMYVYSGAIDVFDFVVSRPSEFPPNTVGRYRNTDPLSLGYIIKKTVEGRGQHYFQFPQSDLFDRIGIPKLVLEPDPYGNFVMTGFEYGRALDWARLGLLHLQDGLWNGERILPEGWVDFVTTPAPAWELPRYGGQFWLNRTKVWNLPEDAYYMAGGGGQYTIIVPSLELVVVRLGHFKGGVSVVQGADAPAMKHLNDAMGMLWELIQPSHH